MPVGFPSSADVRPARRSAAMWFAPFVLLVAAGLLANLGMSPVGKASAASTDNVVVTATVTSNLTVADGCAGAISIAVALGTYADGTCAITFGASNDATTTLRVARPAGTSFFSSIFADEGATCANLGTVDEAGWKVVSATGATNASGCALGAAANNTTIAHKGVTTTPASVCASGSASTTANACTIGVGVFEAGGDAAPAAPTGTLNLDVIA